MTMTICAECSAEISDQAEVCLKCGAPTLKSEIQETNRREAIGIITRVRYRWQGTLITVAAFIAIFLLLDWRNKTSDTPLHIILVLFAAGVCAYWIRFGFFAIMARKLKKHYSLEQLAEIWTILGGFKNMKK